MDSKKVARELLVLAKQITAAPALKPLYFKNTSVGSGGQYFMLKPSTLEGEKVYDVYFMDLSALLFAGRTPKFKRTNSVVRPEKLPGWASLNKMVQIPKEYVDAALRPKPLRLP